MEVQEVNDAPAVVLTLAGELDERFFRDARRWLVRILRQPRVSLTQRVGRLGCQQLDAVARISQTLARFGERVCIELRQPLLDSRQPLQLTGQQPVR